MHVLTAVSPADWGLLCSPTAQPSFYPGRVARERSVEPHSPLQKTDLPLRRPSGVLCCFITVIERETGAEQNSVLCCRGPGYIMHSSYQNISSTDPQIFLKAPFFLLSSLLGVSGPRLRTCDMELKLWIAPIKRELLQADEGSAGDCRATGMLFGDANGILSPRTLPTE